MKKSKIFLTLACAVLLVAASVMGTLAYLTSTDTVTNTFTVGQVKITLNEAPVDTTGKVQSGDRVNANSYKLIPGHTYTKDPTIHVANNSEDSYLFVKVENGISAIEDSTNNIAAQMETKGWKALGDGYENIYVYIGTAEGATDPQAVCSGADVVVFEQFKVDGSVKDVSGYKDAKIVVTAYAVQKDGFEEKTATQIWDAAFSVNP